MEENKTNTQEKKTFYEYVNLPKNVRQIGVPLPGTKIYLEDYVITYLKQCFVDTEESKIVILLGKKGKKEAEKSNFIYGAIELEEQDILEHGKIQDETWDYVHSVIRQCFSGAQVFGCACGVSVWNSDMENKVRKLQKREFAIDDHVLFLWDLCEKEEKIFTWQRGMVKELPGYYIYFEKNPQMQDYMLDKQAVKSIDAEYQDHVTSTMRQVIEEKEEEKEKKWQRLSYLGAVAAGIAILFGVHMMIDSTARIKNMEQTVQALSEYVGNQQEEVAAMSEQTKDAVKKNQSNDDEKEPSGYQKTENEKTADKQTEKGTDETGQAEKDTEQNKDNEGQGENSPAQTGDGLKQLDGNENGQDNGNEAAATNGVTGNDETDSGTENGQSAWNEKDSGSVLGDGNLAENSAWNGQTIQKDGDGSAAKDISEEMAIQAMKKNAQSYIVQKGDTLSQIVWRQYHDFSYEKQVKKVNGITDADKIYVGQCLILPKFKSKQ